MFIKKNNPPKIILGTSLVAFGRVIIRTRMSVSHSLLIFAIISLKMFLKTSASLK